MDNIELLGLAASFLVIVSWIPQVHKSLKTRHMKDFSWGMLALLFISQVLFLTYGILISSLPVALTNAFTTLFVGILAFLKIRHG
ncbi:MAG: SemiSWEET family transporter [Candidatus Micrarchaeota archaeon]|nr:SemiSWEET family transporter [Candidatus Micrarchaeota archaeon]